MKRDRAKTAGFTLIEVLVALAILGVTLGALVKASSEHTRNTHYLQERTLAHWVGQNLVARYEAGLIAPGRGTETGSVRQAGQDWEYSLEIGESCPRPRWSCRRCCASKSPCGPHPDRPPT